MKHLDHKFIGKVNREVKRRNPDRHNVDEWWRRIRFKGKEEFSLAVCIEYEEPSEINAADVTRRNSKQVEEFRSKIIYFTLKLGGHVLTPFFGTCQSDWASSRWRMGRCWIEGREKSIMGPWVRMGIAADEAKEGAT